MPTSLFNNPVVQGFLKPGMKLMRAPQFPAKMTLMAVVLLVPLAWLTTQSLRAAHHDYAATRIETDGVELVVRTLDLVGHVQRHRGLVHRSLGGDDGARALSERTESQASSLEQTTASVQEISNAVLAQITDASGGFTDRDMCVFAFEQAAHGRGWVDYNFAKALAA